MKLQDNLHKIQVDQYKRNNFKWYSSSVMAVFTMIIVYFAILPGINFLYLSTKDATDLKDALIKDDLIPADASIKDAIT